MNRQVMQSKIQYPVNNKPVIEDYKPIRVEEPNKYVNHVNTYYPGYRHMKLNYDNECGDVFKYKANSNRDLVVLTYQNMGGENVKYYKRIPIIIDLYKHVIPNAKKICLTSSLERSDPFVQLMENAGIEMIYNIRYRNWKIVNSRNKILEEYLIEHKNDYDRVIIHDFDAFMFEDVFRTFNENELVMAAECRKYKKMNGCITLNSRPFFKDWFNRAFNNKTLTNDFCNRYVANINAGVYMGGIKIMTQFLHRINSYYNLKNSRLWGVDQAIINKMYYNNELSDLNIVLDHCSQRYCYLQSKSLSTNNSTSTLVYSDGCSPVLLHKGYPGSWEDYIPNVDY